MDYPTSQLPENGGQGYVGLIMIGDALSNLQKLPDGIARTCMTSPPYWGLRDYDLPGQIGVERSLDTYLKRLGEVFKELRRVLTPDGTLWLNIGDSYTSGNRGWRAPDAKNAARAMSERPPNPKGLKDKDLIGVPWRLAFALQKQGWHLRADVIWSKPNAQPESVKDRPTQAHEYVFLFSNAKRYYYDQVAIREPTTDELGLKNRRSVWEFNVTPGATGKVTAFPLELVSRCILAGSEEADVVIDPFFGSGTVGAAARFLNRRFIGVELHPLYAELASSRCSVVGEEIMLVGPHKITHRRMARTIDAFLSSRPPRQDLEARQPAASNPLVGPKQAAPGASTLL